MREIKPPTGLPPSVNDVRVMSPRDHSKEPWPTKAGGKLDVFCALNSADQRCFLNYSDEEVDIIASETGGFDIRGLRLYLTYDVPKPLGEDIVGGHEFHKVRHELLFTIAGIVNWTLEDLGGGVRKIDVSWGQGLWIPPWILHTSRVIEGPAATLVVANTLFGQGYRLTEDAYTAEEFYTLRSD